jgi:beta-lactamase regulating signal transducer with metallopeptidase domain
MILALLAEAAVRSLVVALAVGLGLWIARVRNPRVEATAWTLVLAGALLMPWLMRWRAIEIRPPQRMTATRPVIVRAVREHLVPMAIASRPVVLAKQFDWRAISLAVYAAVAALLLLRMLTGLWLTYLLWRRAHRVHEPWTGGQDIRETSAINAPATFGSSILLPLEWRGWDELKLRAVTAHESAHVAWGDFYVQFVGRIHLAVFWFSPLAWWLENRLIRMAEAASDDAVLQNVPERSSYAEILLQLAAKLDQAPAAVAMARPATVTRRVERLLSNQSLPAKAGWKRYMQVAAAVVCAVAVTAGSSTRAQTPAAPPAPQAPAAPSKPSAAPAPPAPAETAAPGTWWWQTSATGDAYAIVSGDSLNMNGSSKDATRARSYRNRISSDYIWFRHDGKEYLITDAAAVERARELFRSEVDLGRKQAELGEQQAKLGEEQALLSAQQAAASIKMPELDEQTRLALEQAQSVEKQLLAEKAGDLEGNAGILEKLQKELQTVRNHELTQEQLGALQETAGELQAHIAQDWSRQLSELQNHMAELQSQVAELQSKVGEKQSRLGEAQSVLGEQQSMLGEEQSKLGREQSRLAEEASRALRRLFEDSLKNGLARPVE